MRQDDKNRFPISELWFSNKMFPFLLQLTIFHPIIYPSSSYFDVLILELGPYLPAAHDDHLRGVFHPPSWNLQPVLSVKVKLQLLVGWSRIAAILKWGASLAQTPMSPSLGTALPRSWESHSFHPCQRDVQIQNLWVP